MDWYMTASRNEKGHQYVGLPVRAVDRDDVSRQMLEIGLDPYYMDFRGDRKPTPYGNCPTCNTEGIVRPAYMQATRETPMSLLGWILHCSTCACTKRLYRSNDQ